jgi:hypothetical protein
MCDLRSEKMNARRCTRLPRQPRVSSSPLRPGAARTVCLWQSRIRGALGEGCRYGHELDAPDRYLQETPMIGEADLVLDAERPPNSRRRRLFDR